MYTPIRLSTIRPKRDLSFDLYIFYKDQYLKYTSKGQQLEEPTYLKLKKQKLAPFFISAEDEANYQIFLDAILSEGLNDPNKSAAEKVDLVGGHASVTLNKMQKDPSSKEAFKMTEQAAGNIRQVLKSSPDSFKELLNREIADDDILIHHSMNVSAYATKLAALHDCKEEDQAFISLVGLLHDVGHAKLPPPFQKLYLKNPQEFTEEEKTHYQKHAEMAVDTLKKNPLIPPEVIQLVAIHESDLASGKKLTLVEEIISLTNNFDKKVTFFKMNHKDAMAQLQREGLGVYNMELINKFKQLLKLEKVV